MPGHFIALDAGGFTDLSSWGEQHSLYCLQAGVSGLLINGCVRDTAKIRRSGFAAHCLGYTPIKSQWDFETIGVNEPIMIGRVQIRPNDVIVADEDGAVVVPREHATAILDAASVVLGEEQRMRSAAKWAYSDGTRRFAIPPSIWAI